MGKVSNNNGGISFFYVLFFRCRLSLASSVFMRTLFCIVYLVLIDFLLITYPFSVYCCPI